MADVFDAGKRSAIMSRIRSSNTLAELLVFRYLRRQGVYFQRHYSRVPGRPDVALPRKKIAVFIDGDFWHGRDFARLCRNRNDDDYWVCKIRSNMVRDERQRRGLEENGWTVLSVWTSDLERKSTQQVELSRIREFLTGSSCQ